MRQVLAIAFTLISLGLLAETASAKSVVVDRYVGTKESVTRFCSLTGGTIATEPSGAFTCDNADTGYHHKCTSSGACEVACNGPGCGVDLDVRMSGTTTNGRKQQ